MQYICLSYILYKMVVTGQIEMNSYFTATSFKEAQNERRSQKALLQVTFK